MSALLAKMGTYGLLRICLPLMPDATLTVGMPLLGVLGAVGIVYGALCAYAQTDFRKVIAYSSVSHLGFCALAIVAFNGAGITGSVLHMVNHALSTGALFLVMGMIIQRYGSAQIADYSGLWHRLPALTMFAMVFALASVGLPGLNNFVSEAMMLIALFDMRNTNVVGNAFAVVAGIGVFLSAWYTLTLVRRMFFGPLREPGTPSSITDLSGRERLILAPLAVLCLVLGLFSRPVTLVIDNDSARLTQVADLARARAKLNP
jgi:NADH-quinone oxidoreductase subunit M